VADSKAAKNTQPGHVPTEQTRKQVETMSGLGITREDIAALIGTSRSQLQRLYKTELAKGSAQAKTAILRSAFNQAVGAPAEYDNAGRLIRAEVKPVPIMTIFLAKSRAGLREASTVEHTGKGGKPIQHEAKIKLNVAPEDLDV
jgi:AraC-like DNA-binding protein